MGPIAVKVQHGVLFNCWEVLDSGRVGVARQKQAFECTWSYVCAASSPFWSINHPPFLSCLDLVVTFHAGLKSGAIAGIVIGVLALLSCMAFVLWLWKGKKESGAPVHKHSEPQSRQSENGHPAIHQDGLVSKPTPESMLLPVPPPIPPQAPGHTITPPVKLQEQYSPASMPVGDARAEHPVPADVLGGTYAYSPGLPAALVSASGSTRSGSSANVRTVASAHVTTSHSLPKHDTLGSLTTIEPSTGSLALFDPIQVLTKQLDAMHKQGVLLRGRYRMLGSSEQRSGSQGVVRFASLAVNPSKQFAVKFFVEHHHFEVEQALYANASMLDFLPPTDDVSLNALEPHVLGRALPPMIVTEHGESLDEWTHRCKPDFFMCLPIVGHLADRVRKIHSAGLVHRDLKPGNVLWLPSINGFTVIDFGSAARSGEEAGISCSLAYAAPEAVSAYAKGETRMLVTGALDVWSLGVIFYEFLTGSRLFTCSRDDIFRAAAGQALLPWEERDAPQRKAHMRRLGLLRELILAMLDRDPVRRITMAEMYSRLRMLMNRETTM
jgi:hypothetical protein